MNRDELLERLRATRAELGTSKMLAKRLSIPEGTLKAVLSQNFKNLSTIDKVLGKYVECFMSGVYKEGLYTENLICPHIKNALTWQDCQTRAHATRPFGGAAKIAWWQCCQTCPHKTGAPNA